jgi:hypothetical protein
MDIYQPEDSIVVDKPGYDNVTSNPIVATLRWVPKGKLIPEGWYVTDELLINIHRSENYYTADAFGIDEYGIGKSVDDAVIDLLSSFRDCRMVLERREDRLTDAEKGTLSALRKVLGKSN